MNQASSNLADREQLRGFLQNERLFISRREREQGVIIGKKWVGYCKVTFPVGDDGFIREGI